MIKLYTTEYSHYFWQLYVVLRVFCSCLGVWFAGVLFLYTYCQENSTKTEYGDAFFDEGSTYRRRVLTNAGIVVLIGGK